MYLGLGLGVWADFYIAGIPVISVEAFAVQTERVVGTIPGSVRAEPWVVVAAGGIPSVAMGSGPQKDKAVSNPPKERPLKEPEATFVELLTLPLCPPPGRAQPKAMYVVGEGVLTTAGC